MFLGSGNDHTQNRSIELAWQQFNYISFYSESFLAHDQTDEFPNETNLSEDVQVIASLRSFWTTSLQTWIGTVRDQGLKHRSTIPIDMFIYLQTSLSHC